MLFTFIPFKSIRDCLQRLSINSHNTIFFFSGPKKEGFKDKYGTLKCKQLLGSRNKLGSLLRKLGLHPKNEYFSQTIGNHDSAQKTYFQEFGHPLLKWI